LAKVAGISLSQKPFRKVCENCFQQNLFFASQKSFTKNSLALLGKSLFALQKPWEKVLARQKPFCFAKALGKMQCCCAAKPFCFAKALGKLPLAKASESKAVPSQYL
jgi:hypothetical protein